jgi:methylated-DNA-[protein]-cysteine S-methyltransferase
VSRAQAFCLFDTAIGTCGIAWKDQALAGVQLCEGSAHATRLRVEARFAGVAQTAAPANVARAITRIQASLLGAPDNMQALVLDMAGVPEFHAKLRMLESECARFGGAGRDVRAHLNSLTRTRPGP